MNRSQIKFMLSVIRGYKFAFKATGQVTYKNTITRLLNELKLEVNRQIEVNARMEPTFILKAA